MLLGLNTQRSGEIEKAICHDTRKDMLMSIFTRTISEPTLISSRLPSRRRRQRHQPRKRVIMVRGQMFPQTLLHDAPVIHDVDAVAVPDLRHVVRDDYGRAAPAPATDLLHDLVSRQRVEIARDLVQDQNRRVAQPGPGERHALLLSAAEVVSVRSYARGEAVGEIRYRRL